MNTELQKCLYDKINLLSMEKFRENVINTRLRVHQTILMGVVKSKSYVKEPSGMYDGFCHRITICGFSVEGSSLEQAVQKFADLVTWATMAEGNPRDYPDAYHPSYGQLEPALAAYRKLCEYVHNEDQNPHSPGATTKYGKDVNPTVFTTEEIKEKIQKTGTEFDEVPKTF